MKKYIYMVFCCVLMCACTKNIEIIDPYSLGSCIGKIELDAAAGSISVSVETSGDWRVETADSWLTIDTEGRSGNGAFTVNYESNESDVMTLKSGRVGKVTIRHAESKKIHTLLFVQHGFYPVVSEDEVVNDPAIIIEYKENVKTDVTLICCSSDGEGDVQAWLASQNADVVVLDGAVTGAIEGLNVRGCNYADMTVEEDYNAFRSLIQQTCNSGPDAGDDWVFAGQMYHLSAMQAGYAGTPSWYPSKKDAVEFRADLYAWQNNLYDCVWMYLRDYVSTYTDVEGRSYAADYVYASSSVFAKVNSVELLDVDGLSHKAIKITLKY